MPTSFFRYGSRSRAPLFFTCEHAGRALPPGAGDARRHADLLHSHWGWDPGAWALTRALCDRLDAEAFGGRWTRLWLDLNRAPGDPTLIRRRVEDREVAWNVRLDARGRARRLDAVHAPYHAAIERTLARKTLRGDRPWVVAVHTFTGELDGRRRDFELGILFDRQETAARRLGERLERRVSLRYNEPYSGLDGLMYSAARHGAAQDLPCLEIEWNQAALAKPGAVERAADLLAPALLETLTEAP